MPKKIITIVVLCLVYVISTRGAVAQVPPPDEESPYSCDMSTDPDQCIECQGYYTDACIAGGRLCAATCAPMPTGAACRSQCAEGFLWCIESSDLYCELGGHGG